MTEFLLKKFVKNWQNSKDNSVREKVGILSSITGMVCNIFLFVLKFVMGKLSNSVSIISDAFNNLSDCLSCAITMASYKLSAQPADKEHPFGHGRIEYLASLIIAAIIIVVGVQFLQTSVLKLLHPELVNFSVVAVISLIASVLVKIWMSAFNKKLGTDYNSSTMLATSQDSLSDSITTAVTLISLFASLFTDWPVDGVIGIIVSVMILKAGYEIIKDTVYTLIGKPAEQETIDAINDIVFSHPEVLGTHDMIVHNYGPGMQIASLHAEVSEDCKITEIHDVIDNIEKELADQLHILATIHMDPISRSPEVMKYREIVLGVLDSVDKEITMHDFRMVSGDTHTNLIFDIVMPHKYQGKTEELKNEIDSRLQKIDSKLNTVITFDLQF